MRLNIFEEILKVINFKDLLFIHKVNKEFYNFFLIRAKVYMQEYLRFSNWKYLMKFYRTFYSKFNLKIMYSFNKNEHIFACSYKHLNFSVSFINDSYELSIAPLKKKVDTKYILDLVNLKYDLIYGQ